MSTMESLVFERSGYRPITNRRRAVAFALVAAVYAVAVLLLLTLQRGVVVDQARDSVRAITVLPIAPPNPVDPAPNPAPRPPANRRAVPPPPVSSTPARAPAAELAPPALAPPPAAPSAPAASPSAAPTGPIAAGEGDAAYDLDAGGGGSAGFIPPRWLRKVSDDEFFPLVDPELLQAALEVDYRMQCTIALSTRVQCRVLKETPFYPGLRRAVLAAVPLLRMAPGKRDGRLIDGQRVEFWWRIRVSHGEVQLR